MILGTVGVPGNYGGFETLAENLVKFHSQTSHPAELTVYCSSKAFSARSSTYLSAKLCFLDINANGVESVLYDVVSLFDAVRKRADVILLLGVSGALALPFIRLISNARIVTNVDGIEWKREKWNWVARQILKWSEWAAVRWSHGVISDNLAIAEHIDRRYGKESCVIPYGGDHAINVSSCEDDTVNLPSQYVLGLCRIEPENNVAMILETFSRLPKFGLVFVGNWDNSGYGRHLRSVYSKYDNITLLDPCYQSKHLKWIRERAYAYVHGHSAGGTNPSLVEMMHFGIPILAYDCKFNRYTTENAALYFRSEKELNVLINSVSHGKAKVTGKQMIEIANRRYTWEIIGENYFSLMDRS